MGRTMARRMVILGVAMLVLAGAMPAYAGKPEREPYTPPPTVLEPGQACGFDVEIATKGNFTQTTFANGRVIITGWGRDTVTNLGDVNDPNDDISLTLRTSGKITISPDGDRLRASGRTVFYFWEGDQGPFGEVEYPGALYYIVGHVDETFDEDGFVDSFRWSGRATELCSLISP